jgi:hypothetical protein
MVGLYDGVTEYQTGPMSVQGEYITYILTHPFDDTII